MEEVRGRASTPLQKADVLDRLEVVWNRVPRMRLGQLIAAMMQADRGSPDPFYIEDFDLIEKLEQFIDKHIGKDGRAKKEAVG